MHRGHRVLDIHCHLAPLRLARAVRQALHELHGWTVDGPIDPDDVLDDIVALNAMFASGLDDAGLRAVLHENALRFLKLAAMPAGRPDATA